MKVRFGIVGLGHQGLNYANHLFKGKIKNGELGALCSSKAMKEEIYKDEFPGVKFYSNYIDMLKSGDIDAVIVCAPHYFHPELGIKALENDIHLLIEKPAGVYTKQVRELNELSKKKGNLSFGVFYNQRFNPLYQEVKSIIENGEIGDIRRTNWIITTWWRPQVYYEQSSWRGTWEGEGGGVLLNQAPHQLDLWQWICGMPKKVFTKIKFGYKKNISVEDEVTAIVEYPNGSTGVFITCTHDLMGTDRFEIHGDLGKIIIDSSQKLTIKRLIKPEIQISQEVTKDDVSRIVDSGDFKNVYLEEVKNFVGDRQGYHCNLIENFADNILNGTPLISPGVEGINQVALANGMLLSSWLEKEINLPIDEELYLEELNKKIYEEKNNIRR